MKISKARLEQLIEEAIDEVIKERAKSKKSKRRIRRDKELEKMVKHRNVRMTDLHGLEDVGLKREAESKYPCGTPNANPYHKADGTWGSKETAASWAINKKGTDCLSGQFKDDYGRKRTEPCGRKNRKKLCKDELNKDDNRSDTNTVTDVRLCKDCGLAITEAQTEYKELNNLKRKYDDLARKYNKLLAAYKKKKGVGIKDCADAINYIVRSSKGDIKPGTGK